MARPITGAQKKVLIRFDLMREHQTSIRTPDLPEPTTSFEARNYIDKWLTLNEGHVHELAVHLAFTLRPTLRSVASDLRNHIEGTGFGRDATNMECAEYIWMRQSRMSDSNRAKIREDYFKIMSKSQIKWESLIDPETRVQPEDGYAWTPPEPHGGTATTPPKPEPVAEPSATQEDAAAAAVEALKRLAGAVSPEDLKSAVDEATEPVLQVALDAAKVAQEALEAVGKVSAPEPSIERIEVVTPSATTVLEEHTHKIVPQIIRYVGAGIKVWLYGPPGTGKSYMAEQVAKALGFESSVQSFNGLMSPHEMQGFRDANGTVHRSELQRMYSEGGVWIADEIDYASPNMATWLNGPLEASRGTFVDGMIDKHQNFRVIACSNTSGTGGNANHSGAQRQNTALIDRFLQVYVAPDPVMERSVCSAKAKAHGYPEESAMALQATIDKARTMAESEGISGHRFGLRMMLDSIAACSVGCEPFEAIMCKTSLDRTQVERFIGKA